MASMADSQRTTAWLIGADTEKKPRSLLEPGAMPRQFRLVVPRNSAPTGLAAVSMRMNTAFARASA